jgi:capsular polysaccharide biosynthesis protein
VLAAVLAALAANAAGTRGGHRYEARAGVLVGPVSGDVAGLRAAGERAPTYADIATSLRVVTAARARAGLAEHPQRLRRDVKAEARGSSRIITITATAASPGTAARLANAVAVSIGPALYRDPRTVAREFHLVEPAVPPGAPVASHLRSLVVFAAFAGVLACLTVLLIVDYFRGRIATGEELAEVGATTLLGVLDDRTPGGGFDVLAARIRLARSSGAPRSLLVTGDGAERVADDLARAICATGMPVVRLEASERGSSRELRHAARGHHDRPLVLVAAPAPDRSAAALLWARLADGTVLIARRGHTSRDSAAYSAAAVRQVGGDLLGAALAVRGGGPLTALRAALAAHTGSKGAAAGAGAERSGSAA